MPVKTTMPHVDTPLADTPWQEMSARKSGRAGTELLLRSRARGVCGDASEPLDGPFMRADGEDRKDAIFTKELYGKRIEPDYEGLCVLDDRDRVVRMWRALGLTRLHVASGNL